MKGLQCCLSATGAYLNAYAIRLDSFTGEGDELLEFAVSLLDMNYSFPADLGVEKVGFELAGDKPRR